MTCLTFFIMLSTPFFFQLCFACLFFSQVDLAASSTQLKVTDEKKAAPTEPKKDEKEGEKKAEEAKKEEPEPDFEIKENPARVTLQQGLYVSFDVDDRYTPIKKDEFSGILLLKDNQVGKEEKFVELKVESKTSAPQTSNEEEAKIPEPFEFDANKEK